MNMKNRLFKEFLIPSLLWSAATCAGGLTDRSFPVLSGVILILTALVCAGWFLALDRSLVSFRFLLSFSWGVGEGMAAMRLSRLMGYWTWMSWASFLLFYVCFLGGFLILQEAEAQKDRRNLEHPKALEGLKDVENPVSRSRLLTAVIVLTIVSTACFFLEAHLLGFIPAFSKETHAYNTFHITGIHYLTVSGCLVPGLETVWFLSGKRTGRQMAVLLLCCLAAFAVPVLSLSKFDLVVCLVLPIGVWFLMRPALSPKQMALVVGGVILLIAAATVYTTLSRHYKPGYIGSIFQMRDEDMPVALQYVYMYVSNNFANFNVLTERLRGGTIPYLYGIKQLFPLFALTGLKFLKPSLVSYPLPITKTELNTLTIIYDAYYDFGLAGVIGFGLIFGAVCALLRQAVNRSENPIFCFLYAETALYAALSFFSAWFSVPTTWFWYAVTLMIWLFVQGSSRKRQA